MRPATVLYFCLLLTFVSNASASEPPTDVSATATDGTSIYGDHYPAAMPGATSILLFHQASGDSQGEYTNTANRLVNEGFEVYGWDARSGGDRFGFPNRTVTAMGASVDSYCEAYPDLVAALKYVSENGSGGPILAIGSSYSAALVFRLAAEHDDQLAGIAAFSPASSRMDACEVNEWLPKVSGVPILVFRPESEMEYESVQQQLDMFKQHGIEVVVTKESLHGSSMLNPERNKGDVEPAWARLLGFLKSPAKAGQ